MAITEQQQQEKKKKKRSVRRVVMVAFSALGHINPMLTLGHLLVSKGLDVTLVTTEPARLLFPPSSTTTPGGIHLHFMSEGCTLPLNATTDMGLFVHNLQQFGPPNLSAFLNRHPQNHFSCVIINPFVPWAAPVAAHHGIPCALFWIQPCTLYAIYYRFFNALNKFPTSETPTSTVDLPGLPLLDAKDLPSFVLPSNSHPCFTKTLADVFCNMDNFKWVLGNSYYQLEHDVIHSMDNICPIIPVGPLIRQDKRLNSTVVVNSSESCQDCIRWLDEQASSSVIYISFGSIIEFSKTAVESISDGLKKSSRPFLWVVKDEKVLPSDFLDGTKDQGKIVSWCPQIEVLSHPSVGCFLTHCGWNSLLESITLGVSTVAYPQWTDQPTNAKLLTDILGVGVTLGMNETGFTSDDVAVSIENVMTSKEIKKKVAGLKLAAEEALAPGGSSDENIQAFVDEIVNWEF